MTSLVLTIRETLRYRGAIGQWSWVLHRVSGLGVVLFLTLHVIDTSWAVFYPGLYEKAIAAYQSPLFTIGEFVLVACVIYHAFNGLRIAIMDNRPELWKYQERGAWIVLGATVLVLVPLFLGMGYHTVVHYQKPDVFILGIGEVLVEQLPFAVGIVVAMVGAVLLSFVYGLVTGAEAPKGSAKAQGSAVERFWWSFMRVSGALIIPLVFGHLAAMHVLQGVFDLTVARDVVGVPTGEVITVPSLEEAFAATPSEGNIVEEFVNATDARALALANNATLGNGFNDSATATEFVMERWGYLMGGIAIWKLYDVALLALVTIHGFNGLRYVLTDYTQFSPTLRRAAGYLCVIGAVTLLVVGAGALVSTIQPEAIAMADQALRALRAEHFASLLVGG